MLVRDSVHEIFERFGARWLLMFKKEIWKRNNQLSTLKFWIYFTDINLVILHVAVLLYYRRKIIIKRYLQVIWLYSQYSFRALVLRYVGGFTSDVAFPVRWPYQMDILVYVSKWTDALQVGTWKSVFYLSEANGYI